MLSTVEIVELEKKLFRYRFKQRIHYALFFIVFSCLGAGVYFFYPLIIADAHQSNSKPEVVETNMTKMSTVIEDSNETNESKETIVERSTTKQEDTLLLQLPVISSTSSATKKTYAPPPEDFDTSSVGVKEERLSNKISARKLTDTVDEPTFYRSKEEQIDATLLPPPPLGEEKPKGFIKIESHEINSISYLKEKFDSTHNIVFALMLAEEYYLNKNYTECNKWALIANNIDADNEKSWVWFAKSKVKLGNKDDAILALKTYLKNNKSQAAQSLLNQITLGETIN